MSDRSDSELARAWIEGDVVAFAEVHSRHAGHLLGLASILAVDPAVALGLLHDTFLHASAGIHRLNDPDRLRAWLFALLRATAHHRPGCRRPPDLTVLAERLPDRCSDPLSEPSPRELAEALWTAVNGLDPTDRELLELYLLGNLEACDLAAVLGIHPGNAAMLLFQLRERMERTIGALVVARLGRWDCRELDLALQGWDGRFTRAIGTTVTRHVERCPDCARRRRAAFTLDRLSPALPGARTVPAEARARAVADFARRTPPPSQGSWRWRQDGFPDLRTTQAGAPVPLRQEGTGQESAARARPRGRRPGSRACVWQRSWESRRYQAFTALAGVLVLSSSVISLGALMAASQGAAPSLTIPLRTRAGSYPSRPWPQTGGASVSRSSREEASARDTPSRTTGHGGPSPSAAPPPASPTERRSPGTDTRQSPGASPTASGTAPSAGTANPPLSISPGILALGGTARTGSVHVLNTSDESVSWTLTVTGTGLTAAPRTGVLGPGDGTRVQLELDRQELAGGSMTGALVFRSAGTTWTVLVSASPLSSATPVEGRAVCRRRPDGTTASPTAAPICQELLDLDQAPRHSRPAGFPRQMPDPDRTPSPAPARSLSPAAFPRAPEPDGGSPVADTGSPGTEPSEQDLGLAEQDTEVPEQDTGFTE